MKAVVKKVIGSLICAFVYMKFVTIYPIEALKGKSCAVVGACEHDRKNKFLIIA